VVLNSASLIVKRSESNADFSHSPAWDEFDYFETLFHFKEIIKKNQVKTWSEKSELIS